MWIELSKEEAELIKRCTGGEYVDRRRTLRTLTYMRFKAIVAAGDEPRVLDADGKVKSSKRLWDYSTEDDILNLANQHDKKLTPEQLVAIVLELYENEAQTWQEKVEDALNEIICPDCRLADHDDGV